MAQVGKGKCEKLTKINILHMAINYIGAMENLILDYFLDGVSNVPLDIRITFF